MPSSSSTKVDHVDGGSAEEAGDQEEGGGGGSSAGTPTAVASAVAAAPAAAAPAAAHNNNNESSGMLLDVGRRQHQPTATTDGNDTDNNELQTLLQLRLYAANLPRQGLFGLPDTYAVVTLSGGGGADGGTSSGLPFTGGNTSTIRSLGETEIITQSRNPQWTKTLQLNYKYGDVFYFYVHVMEAPPESPANAVAVDKQRQKHATSTTTSSSHKNGTTTTTTTIRPVVAAATTAKTTTATTNSNGTSTSTSNKEKISSKSYGTALFEVSDILGTRNSTKVKRLRAGGCIFCRIEPITREHVDRLVKIRLTCQDVVLPHGRRRNATQHLRVQNFLFNKHKPSSSSSWKLTASRAPTVIYEIAKRPMLASPAASSQQHQQQLGWISVYRSPPVVADPESGAPGVVEAVSDLSTLCNGDYDRHLRISLYESSSAAAADNTTTTKNTVAAQLGECIGMAETTLRVLLSKQRGTVPPTTRASLYGSPTAAQDKDSSGGAGAGAHQQNNKNDDGQGATNDYCDLFLQRNASKLKEVGRLRVLNVEITGQQQNDVPAMSSTPPPSSSSAITSSDTATATIVDVVDLTELRPLSATTQQRFHSYVERTEFDVLVAIDFTSSNGDPRKEGSLHFQAGCAGAADSSLNDYEETITAIVPALLACNGAGRDGADDCTVWGFGAKFDGVVRHLFDIGGGPVRGVDGILSRYRSLFAETGIVMSGPTVFDQVIQAAACKANRHHKSMTAHALKYSVLLIITDGISQNIEETQRKLAVYATMPLSVIFVGVGKSDFGLMYYLCDPTSRAKNGISRHITTFVEFRRLQDDPTALGQAALSRLPDQLIEYMRSRGFSRLRKKP